MKKTVWITISLAGLAIAVGVAMGSSGWGLACGVGAVWGLANAWTLQLVLQTMTAPKRSSGRLALLLLLKLAGLYSLAVWCLVGLRLSPVAWLCGFTLSLVGLGFSAAPSLRQLFNDGGPGA